MYKRVFSFLLAWVSLLALTATPAAFATGDDYSVRIVGQLDSNTKHQSRDTYTVEFRVRADKEAKVQGLECVLAYDASVFDLVTIDGTKSLSETGVVVETGLSLLSDPPLYDFTPSLPAGWNPMLCVAASSDGKTAYVVMQAFRMSATTVDTQTTLHKIRLAFKPGKSLNDVSENTIRFATTDEILILGGADSQAQIFDENAVAYKYGRVNGTPDELSKPVFELTIGDTTSNRSTNPETGSDFEYSLVDGGITITGYNGDGSVIYVPSEIDGYPVVAVEKGVFSDLPDDVIISSDNAIRAFIEESGVPSDKIMDSSENDGLPFWLLIAILTFVVILGGGAVFYFKNIRRKKHTD
jgi:hypothetical protein